MSDEPSQDENRDLAEAVREEQVSKERQLTRMTRDARAVFRAVEGWPHIRDRETWLQTCEEAVQNYQSGRFLIEQLGAERYLDPAMMATIWHLRQQLLEEFDARTSAEAMMVDLAILGYYNAMRIQGWIGNLALLLEHEAFGRESPTAAFQRSNGRASGLVVEDHLRDMGEQMLPLLDRANRMMLRNLKAIKELRQRPMPAVAIHQASQVNVGAQQINAAMQELKDGEQ
jgi:hypothetical protein